MEFFFVSAKIIIAFILLILLPGLLLIYQLRARLSGLDFYEKASYGLILGMAFWIPIAWISYGFGMNSKAPIYLSILITVCLACHTFYKSNISFQKIKLIKREIFSTFDIYIFIVIVQSVLIGYTSQFQTGNSDALAHIAGIKNLATFETIQNYDHILGVGIPIPNTYGNNPLYLCLAMIAKLSDVDFPLAYSTITGAIYFFSVFAIYTLFKTISGSVLISKIGSLIFTLVSLIIWINDNGYTTYNLNSHWIIFPQAIVNYILFPIMLAAFIRYIFYRDSVFLFVMALFLLTLTRFHPNWLFWAPLIISGILIFWNIVCEIFGAMHKINYRLILWVGLIGFISALGFFVSKNTFSADPNLISPISLWRSSGGNLLYFSESTYFYHPLIYLKSRGYLDICTISMLWYLSSKGVKNSKELLVIFSCFLLTIFLIIFNPLIVVPLVKVFGTPIPLYRAFELMWPSLSVISIYSVLAVIQLKSKKYPRLPRYIAIAGTLLSLAYFGKNIPFLMGVYENQGGYYSTNSSPFSEPFITLRSLGEGKIAVRTPLATPIASFTHLDPITTEKWRYQKLADFDAREKDNIFLLTFDGTYNILSETLNKYKVRYIVVNNSDLTAISNFNKYPSLIHFRAHAGDNQIWEVTK